MDTDFLRDMGLTAKEADVYMTLIYLKSASIFDIISKAKVSRQTAYEILQKLLDKGLINYTIINKKKRFRASNPEKLLDIIKEKEASVKDKLPALLKKYKEKEKNTKVEMYLGKEGMKTITDNILKTEDIIGNTIYILAGEGKIFEFLKYYVPQFQQKKVKKKIISKVIFNENVRKKNLTAPLGEIRYIPDKYGSALTIIIYGNNINILVFSEADPIAIHIQNKEITDSFMNNFNLMWSIAKE